MNITISNIGLADNYENVKLLIDSPDLNNVIILILLFVLSALFLKKNRTSLLDRSQTDQIKGLAVLLVVTGHLWVHVSEVQAVPVLGDYAVSIFLLFSGFGLTTSLRNKPLTIKHFFTRRLTRVMIPYWIITILILILDHSLLGRTYSSTDIFNTFLGLNFSKPVLQLDYVRWFITLLLIFYFIFFVSNYFFSGIKALFSIVVFTVLLFVLRIFEFLPFGYPYQIIVFPVGCLIAHYYEELRRTLEVFMSKWIPSLLLFGLFIAFSITALFIDKPGVFFELSHDLIININAVFFAFLLIILFYYLGLTGYFSRFLSFCGIVSYEVYLLHGPFLIKYNPVFKLISTKLIVLSFYLYLSLILLISFLFYRIFLYINNLILDRSSLS